MIVDYPTTLAMIAYHISDSYSSTFGTSRWNFYTAGHDPKYVPDIRFDGLGDNLPPDYYPPDTSLWRGQYLARQPVTTDTTIELSARQITDKNFEATAHVCIEAGGASKTMRIWMAWLQDIPNAAYYPHNNTCRGGLTLGDVTVDPGSCQDTTAAFAFDNNSWTHLPDVQLVGWAQAPLATHPAEVYQATKLHWPDMTPAFTYAPDVAFATEPVQFTDATAGTVVPTAWEWDFGDGGTSTEQNPLHTFATMGTYAVTLRVTGGGWSITGTQNVEIHDTLPPTPAFLFSPPCPDVGQTVYFLDATTGYPTSWAWDFSDGGTSTDQSPNHAFAASGLYTVTLAATNQWGTNTTDLVVEVGDADAIFSDGYEGNTLAEWSSSVP